MSQTSDGDNDGSLGTSYRNGSGVTLWDAVSNASYNQNIIGIGRDSRTSLDQRISRSADMSDILTIATTSNFV